jgi:hypothetical protein
LPTDPDRAQSLAELHPSFTLKTNDPFVDRFVDLATIASGQQATHSLNVHSPKATMRTLG